MQVTMLQNVSSNKFKVYLDEEFAFVLYKGELSRYKIKENQELEEDDYKKIKEEIIIKRAKKRILYLLEQMARSENQIRKKLKENYYTYDVIDIAVEYAKSFGYINDEIYARSYVQMKLQQKSRKEIYFGLIGKGIDKEIIDTILDEAFVNQDEKDLIKKLIKKKGYDTEKMDRSKIQKLNGFLMRKGFSYTQIREVLERMALEETDTF